MTSEKSVDSAQRLDLLVPRVGAVEAAVPPGPDSWRSLGGLSGFTVQIGRYRFDLDRRSAVIEIEVTGTATHANSVTFNNTMNSAYWPGTARHLPLARTGQIGANLTDQASRIFVDTNGQVTVFTPGNDTASFGNTCYVPLDLGKAEEMTATLSEQAALAASPGFQARVHATMTAAAASIAGIPQGATGPQAYAMRTALAVSVLQDAGPDLERFAWAMATNAAVSGDMHQPVAIAGTAGGMPAVITTSAPHGFATGQVAEICAAKDATVDGTWLITVIDTTHFSIPSPGRSFEQAGGYVTAQPADASLQTAVNVCWSALGGVTSATV